MSIAAWIVVGLVAGSLAKAATGSEHHGCLGTLAIGIIGALIGGALCNAAGERGITEFGLWSVLVAFVGATLLLLVFRAVGGRPDHRSRSWR